MNVRKVVWSMPTAKNVDYINQFFRTGTGIALNNITFYFQKNKLTGMVMQRNNSEFQGFMKHSRRFASEFTTAPYPVHIVQHAKIFDNGKYRTTMFIGSFRKNNDIPKAITDKHETKIEKPALLSHKFLKAWLDRSEKERKIRFKVGF